MTDSQPIVVQDRALPLFHLSIANCRGSLMDPLGKEGSTRLLYRLMRRSVLGMTTEEVDEKIDAMGSTLSFEVGRHLTVIHGGCIARSQGDFLDLIQNIITQPNFDETEFSRLKQEARAEWVESLDSDSTVARRFFSQHLFKGHPYSRSTGGTPTSIDRIELEDLKTLYAQAFSHGDLQLASAGDINTELAANYQTTLNRFSTNLSSTKPSAELSEDCDHPEVPAGRRLLFVDKPQRSQSQILIGGLGTHPKDDDHTAFYVGNTIFGGTFSARLSQEVRAKRGWSYGAYSSLPFDKKRQAFSMWTFPKADDSAPCIRLQLEMLRTLIDKGVTQKELSAAKKYLENSHAFTIDTAAKRASLALDEKTYDLPAGYYGHQLEKIQALSVEDVNAALNNRLSADNLLLTVLGSKSEIFDEVRGAIDELAEETVVAFNEGV